MRSEKFDKIIKKTPLETRLKVVNRGFLYVFASDLGHKEITEELYEKISEFADKHTKSILRIVEEWERDKKTK